MCNSVFKRVKERICKDSSFTLSEKNVCEEIHGRAVIIICEIVHTCNIKTLSDCIYRMSVLKNSGKYDLHIDKTEKGIIDKTKQHRHGQAEKVGVTCI